VSAAVETSALADQPWPSGGLETVGACPICATREKALIHDGLWDNVFFAAPGRWSLWRCRGCRSAYLDPRPDADTIGLAYSRYYTHDRQEPPPPVGALQRLRAALGNDYRNRRYGTHRSPANALGKPLALAFAPLRWPVDVAFRFLPRVPGRVFDLGCGGGDFLEMAREAGWEVAGSDPDPVARARAGGLGIEVRATPEAWGDQAGAFDAVTMNHVIEHVHDPLATLATTLRLLRPGGMLYIETPNIDAIGHDIYGPNWRGLETPRHLVLFNRKSLKDALEASGFVGVRYRARLQPFTGLSLVSRRMAAGIDPFDEADAPSLPPLPGRATRLRAAVARGKAEFLTLTCRAPS